MSLLDVCRKLFSYLVQFRERATGVAPPGMEEVQEAILGIFAGMEAQTNPKPQLAASYKQVKYALVALADEVILNSGWKFANKWEQNLLEERYFGSNVAGDRFYELVGKLDGAPRDVVAVFYYCLALGFRGHFRQNDERLLSLKSDLLTKLQKSSPANAPISPGQIDAAAKGRQGILRGLWRWRTVLIVFGVLVLAALVVDRFLIWPVYLAPVSEVASLAEDRLSHDAMGLMADNQSKKVRYKLIGKAGSEAGSSGKTSAKSSAETSAPPTGQDQAPASSSTSQKKPGMLERAEKKIKWIEQEAKGYARDVEHDLGILAGKTKTQPSGETAGTAAAPKTAVQAKARGYMVQVATFNTPHAAESIVKALEKDGYKGQVMMVDRSEGRLWYVAITGPYGDFQTAKQAKDKLGKLFRSDPFIVPAERWGNWARYTRSE